MQIEDTDGSIEVFNSKRTKGRLMSDPNDFAENPRVDPFCGLMNGSDHLFSAKLSKVPKTPNVQNSPQHVLVLIRLNGGHGRQGQCRTRCVQNMFLKLV